MTLANFHDDGKLYVDMQWFIRRETEDEIAGAAIFGDLIRQLLLLYTMEFFEAEIVP